MLNLLTLYEVILYEPYLSKAEVMEAGFTKALPHCDYDATDDIISRFHLTSNNGDK